MLRRLSAALLAILALLPASWAAAQSGCGVAGEPCCCEDDKPTSGPGFIAEDHCCCEVTPAREAPTSPQLPRDLAASPLKYAMDAFECVLPPVPEVSILSSFRMPAFAEPRAPPGPLYLRSHAFLC
ncbi:MAG: hypothetical protein O3A20_09055 [Planctomycetota bacterium]|nr:hypothetical protein [Planctomycetota bacterium]